MPGQKRTYFFFYLGYPYNSKKQLSIFSTKSVKVDCARLLEHLIKSTEIHQCLAITDETLLKKVILASRGL